MKNRCLNPNTNSYPNYGGRGIGFDERWREFEAFYADVGDPPDGLSLDRPDNNGNYGPAIGVGPIGRHRTATVAVE